MTRKCLKCSEELVVNSKLGYMECVSGLHIEPINLTRPQWWNICPRCGIKGLNEADQEARIQALDENYNPIIINGMIKFNEQTAKSITCKGCGFEFTKK